MTAGGAVVEHSAHSTDHRGGAAGGGGPGQRHASRSGGLPAAWRGPTAGACGGEGGARVVGRPRTTGSACWAAACGAQSPSTTFVPPIRCEDHRPGRQVEGPQGRNRAAQPPNRWGPDPWIGGCGNAQSDATSSRHLWTGSSGCWCCGGAHSTWRSRNLLAASTAADQSTRAQVSESSRRAGPPVGCQGGGGARRATRGERAVAAPVPMARAIRRQRRWQPPGEPRHAARRGSRVGGVPPPRASADARVADAAAAANARWRPPPSSRGPASHARLRSIRRPWSSTLHRLT